MRVASQRVIASSTAVLPSGVSSHRRSTFGLSASAPVAAMVSMFAAKFRRDVDVFKDHAGDSALAETIVAEVYDKAERHVHELHVGQQLGLVLNHVGLLLVKGLAFDDTGGALSEAREENRHGLAQRHQFLVQYCNHQPKTRGGLSDSSLA